MLTLQRGSHHGLLIAPRWPSTRIQLEEEVLQRLLDAQAMLPAGLRLLLTRGFEPGHSRLGGFRRVERRLGIAVFRTCYPQRRDEIDAIFAHHAEAVAQVKRSLQQCGFELHRNPTEALQIHCDYRPR